MLFFIHIYRALLIYGFARGFLYSDPIDAVFTGMISMIFTMFLFPIVFVQDVMYGIQRCKKGRKKNAAPFPFQFFDEYYIAPIKNKNNNFAL